MAVAVFTHCAPRSLLFAILTIPLVGLGATKAHTALPLATFPPHTHIHVRRTVSNATIDCVWSFAACDELTGRPVTSQPSMHTRTMDQLHRVGGWEEDGVVPYRMAFVVWVNRFQTAPASRTACEDMSQAQRGTGFPHREQPLKGVGGELGWTVYIFGGGTMNLICTWAGETEIESTATWETGNGRDGTLARRSQVEQIQAAIMIG